MVKAKNYFQGTIRERNVVTIPQFVINQFGAQIGDDLVFKKEGDKIIVGVIKRTFIEENIKFTVNSK